MKNLFIIEHNIEKFDSGSITITLFKVNLMRKGKKNYVIHTYEEQGWIKKDSAGSISHQVKDLFTLRYINLLYLKEQSIQVSNELINELMLQNEQRKF